MNHDLAEAMAYMTEAHTSLIVAKEESAGRLEDSFNAALQLVEELNCELALLHRRAICEKGCEIHGGGHACASGV